MSSKPIRTALRRLRAAWLVLRHGDEQERRERERQAEERARSEAVAEEFRSAYSRFTSRAPLALDGTPIKVGKPEMIAYFGAPIETQRVVWGSNGGTASGGFVVAAPEEPTS